MLKALIFVCLLVSCYFHDAFAAAQVNCELRRLAFRPEKELGSYVARERSVQVALTAEPPVGAVPLFNEPLVVRRSGSEKDCSLGEGIWDKAEIYLSEDGKTLAAVESSGSSSDLSFFDTVSCKKIGSIDISGLDYKISPGRIVYRGVCEYTRDDKSRGSCSPAAVYDLSRDCRPRRMDQESLALTQKIFGVAFSSLSEIEFPHSSKARVLSPGK